MKVTFFAGWIAFGLASASMLAAERETLPPLDAGGTPATLEGAWAGFDPRKEPLAVELLKEWNEDGVALKFLRYHIGVFKSWLNVLKAGDVPTIEELTLYGN